MGKFPLRCGLAIGALAALLLFGGSGSSSLRAAAQPASSPDEFFIVSSVDVAQRRLVLKRPSEVTVLVRVTPKTSYRSEENRPLDLPDLRAGDTVFVRLGAGSEADIAKSIRKGPMTLDELHRRYLRTR